METSRKGTEMKKKNWWDKLFAQIKELLNGSKKQKPKTPPVVEPPVIQDPPNSEPEPTVVVAESEMQWFERDGHIVFRIKAAFGPRGYSIVTAHGHKDVDPPPPMTEAEWLSANNNRPATRIVDGFCEWELKQSGQQIAESALAHHRNSGPVVMLFCKTAVVPPGGHNRDIAFWVNPTQTYGVTGGRAPRRNIDNGGWGEEM
jgi:hypothetical protein